MILRVLTTVSCAAATAVSMAGGALEVLFGQGPGAVVPSLTTGAARRSR